LYKTTGVNIGPLKNVHAGSWGGLPDVGATEWVKSARASEPTSNIKGPYGQTSYITPQANLQIPTTSGGGGGGTGDVLGANTQAPTGTSTGDNGQAEAEAQRQRELDIIRQRLESFKTRAASEREQAQGRFNDFKTSAGSRFQTLRDQLSNTVSSSLENLGQEKVNTQNLYGRAAGTARQAMESAVRGNRTQARAQNRLNSSFYDDRQADTRLQFGKGIADTATEEAGKVAGIGTRETETKNYGETEEQKLGQEENDLVTEAQQQLNTDLAEAEQLERVGLVDYASAENDILTRHASRLDAIRNYIDNRNLRLTELAATYGNKIGGYQAITPELSSTLSNNSALNNVNTLATSYNTPVTTTASAGNKLAFRGSTDENQRRLEELGLLFA
jgi:hypothetical protein